MTPLLHWAIDLTLTLYATAMILATVRLLMGPQAPDRILALDFLYITGMLMMLVLGIRNSSFVYFTEAALLIAMFGFFSSSALAKFLLRGEVIES